jgi:hypothetical protein
MSLLRSLTAEPMPIAEAVFTLAPIPRPTNDLGSDVR